MFKNGMRPVHPREVLREDYLVPLGLTASALAKALNVPPPRIHDLVRQKRSVTADTAMRQILRCMGWVGRHLAVNRKVFGVVLATDISEKLRYAATQVPQVQLMEYELRFAVKPADLSSGS